MKEEGKLATCKPKESLQKVRVPLSLDIPYGQHMLVQSYCTFPHLLQEEHRPAHPQAWGWMGVRQSMADCLRHQEILVFANLLAAFLECFLWVAQIN